MVPKHYHTTQPSQRLISATTIRELNLTGNKRIGGGEGAMAFLLNTTLTSLSIDSCPYVVSEHIEENKRTQHKNGRCFVRACVVLLMAKKRDYEQIGAIANTSTT